MEHRARDEWPASRAAHGDRAPATERDRTLQPAGRREARRIGGACSWLVYERRVDDLPHPRLVFECPTVIRTVRRYPANWRDLSDEDLLALSEHV